MAEELSKGLNSLTLHPGSTAPPLENGKLRIYNMRFCPYAQRTLIYLNAKKIPHEVVNVNLKNKPDWFVAKNPLGKVPVLERDGDVIYESLVCNEWLDTQFPANRILPQDPTERAKAYMTVERLSKITSAFYGMMTKKNEEAVQALRDALKAAENELKGDYFAGSQPGFVDYAIVPWLERIAITSDVRGDEMKLKLSDTPRLEAYWKRIAARPEVAATLRPAEVHQKFFASYFSGEPNYDVGIQAA